MKSVVFSVRGPGVDRLPRELEEKGYYLAFSENSVSVLMLEKYYFRASGYMAATVILSVRGDVCEVKIVSSGGGSGLHAAIAAASLAGADRSLRNRIKADIEKIAGHSGWGIDSPDRKYDPYGGSGIIR